MATRARPALVDEKTRRALRLFADDLRQFARNGRWGTCGGCPRDPHDNAYPEFCAYAERHDHQLTLRALTELFEAEQVRR